ncbi:predicted protein [Thalassiosira pseudonana CCMP1335]|uniref:Pseudouridine synthase RsuA/RluA-like domain-containing protein n=1 Tax=Thalassiosira pseudonana TaxID=35128 RepID=B8BQ07_THAPS|nr:predicted protein [Thalassiosira pseudonana CCMP1335]EED95703.1 predicted protein [Thalassiosira pseudonana CCMP1335]
MATASTASTASLTNVPPHLTIRVLYSDDDIVVIDKPANLRSVPGHASNSPDADDGSKSKYQLHVVHRLDCQTSGIMVVARNSTAASKLCHAWRERDIVQKTYLAYCQRWPPYHDEQLSEGTIDLPLAASRTERIKWEVRALEDGGKPLKSELTVERDNDNGVVLELKPITGRTHQLRIHCATIGSGIVGDSLYGDSPVEWFGDKPQHGQQTISQSDTQTLRLHAHKLVFPHPSTGSEVTFVSPKLW